MWSPSTGSVYKVLVRKNNNVEGWHARLTRVGNGNMPFYNVVKMPDPIGLERRGNFHISRVSHGIRVLPYSTSCESSFKQFWSRWIYDEEFTNPSGTKTYQLHRSLSIYEEAVDTCRNQFDGVPVMIKSQTEGIELYSGYVKLHEKLGIAFDLLVWHGLTRTIDSSWVYGDGEPLGDYSNWRVPVVSNTTLCSSILFPAPTMRKKRQSQGIEWFPSSCEELRNVLCEKAVEMHTWEYINSKLDEPYALTDQTFPVVVTALLNITLANETNDAPRIIDTFIALSYKSEYIEISRDSMENILIIANWLNVEFAENQQTANQIDRKTKYNITVALVRFANRVIYYHDGKVLYFNASTIRVKIVYNIELVRNRTEFQYNYSDENYFIELPITTNKNSFGIFDKIISTFYTTTSFFESNFTTSKILGLKVDDREEIILSDPVLFSNNPRKPQRDEIIFRACAFWNVTILDWAVDGCSFVEGTRTCQCNHLTNFAIISQAVDVPITSQFTMNTKIISSCSTIPFAAVVIIYIVVRKLRRTSLGFCHINLCFTLMTAYIAFGVGIGNIYNTTVCIISAAIIHYFVLCAWAWVMIEAIVIHRLLVSKVVKISTRFKMVSGLCAYIFPLLIVAGTVGLTVGFFDQDQSFPEIWVKDDRNEAVFNSSYVSEHYCWLHDEALFYGFYVEISLTFLVNCIINSVSLYSITCGRDKFRSTHIADTQDIHIFHAVFISIILGVGWCLAIPVALTSRDPHLSKITAYTFASFRAFEGIMIFYVLCFHSKSIRKEWLHLLSRVCSPSKRKDSVTQALEPTIAEYIAGVTSNPIPIITPPNTNVAPIYTNTSIAVNIDSPLQLPRRISRPQIAHENRSVNPDNYMENLTFEDSREFLSPKLYNTKGLPPIPPSRKSSRVSVSSEHIHPIALSQRLSREAIFESRRKSSSGDSKMKMNIELSDLSRKKLMPISEVRKEKK